MRLAEAVIDWIAEVVGDQPFAVVGQSFGGQIARAVTPRFGSQVRGSVLLAPVVRRGEGRTLLPPRDRHRTRRCAARRAASG